MNVRQIVKMAVPITADSTDDLLTSDVVGRKTDTAIQVAGNTASLVRYAKGGVTALGDPTAHTLASLTAKLGNIARSIDVIMGARWDTLGDLGTDIAAILTAIGVGGGVIGQLSYYGVVTAVPGANQFTIPGLAGLGANKFADAETPHRAFVLRTAGGTGAAPQGEMQKITAYVTATGIFTTDAFSAAVGIGDEIMILHPRVAESGDLPELVDGVWVDADLGAAGTAWPIGTPSNPVSNLANAITICATRGTRRIYLSSTTYPTTYTAAVDMAGYHIIGISPRTPRISFDGNGKAFGGTVFENIDLTGVFTGVIFAHACHLLGATCNGYIFDSRISSLTLNGNAAFGRPEFMQGATIDYNNVLRVIYILGGTGDISLVNSTNAGITGYIWGNGLYVEIAASSTQGTWRFEGICRVVNNGGAAHVITDNTINGSLGAVGDTATLDNMSDVATTSAQAKLRRLLLRLSSDAFTATIQGAARTELDTMLAQIATYLADAGAAYSATVNPGAAAKTNIEETLEDIGDMLAGAGIATYPAAAVPGDGISLAEVARQIYNDVVAIAAANVLHEQADVAISDIAPIAPLVFNVLNLAAANTRYVVRALRIKTVDPTPNTITVRLYKLVNDAPTEVNTFVITGANYGTYLNLMDMFGLPQLVGDQLKVTIEASAVGYVFLGQYELSTATV